jgi:hypothetical protein
MAMIVRIAINSKEIRCYAIQRITHIDEFQPTGKVCDYQVREYYSGKYIGKIKHNYDHPPERLVLKAMTLILGSKK